MTTGSSAPNALVKSAIAEELHELRPGQAAEDKTRLRSTLFPRKIATLRDVVEWDLCTGCGACFYACPKGGVSLVDEPSIGIRPRFESDACGSCRECLSICPGYSVDARLAVGPTPYETEADHEFGPALEIWEGYATDSQIRYGASSGGLLSALALYCLEHENMDFVLHSAMDEARPWISKTVQSKTRDDILRRMGSRYAPTSPCDGLQTVEESPRQCVFIGKPCDVAATAMLRKSRPKLDRNLGLVLTFFCAGTPSTRGTLDLVRSLGITPEEVNALRYRGEGWPGRFKVSSQNGAQEKSYSYAESWGKLAGYRPLRCHLCPDGLGRVADIACGDAWERPQADEPGHSIAIVRTPRGREILRRALLAHYVELKPVGPEVVFSAQPNLLSRRRELFGRLFARRAMLIPIPQFHGFSLFHSWLRLPRSRSIRSVLGTLRRAVLRGMWRRRAVLVPATKS